MTYQSFGGTWTVEKLEILRGYLDAYTTALKDQPFPLTYVDAFAGYGSYQPGAAYGLEDYNDFRGLRDGSPRIALEVKDKPFDRLVFIEKDPAGCQALERLRAEHPERNIEIQNRDANVVLPSFCQSLQPLDRAVVFLDPFATEVSWDTVAAIAQTGRIDCWILFPLKAIAQMMPRDNEPTEALSRQLDRIFGGRSYWEDFYTVAQQQMLLPVSDEPVQERLGGSDQIAARYRERLESVFNRVASNRKTLRNSRNSPMFELFFAASNPTGAPIAARIANHLLENW